MPEDQQTAGIILAAGRSQRFGRPKQLLKLGNRYMLEWVLDAALASRLAKVVLVLGHEHQKIAGTLGSRLDHPKLEVAINPRYAEGQSRSLQAGLTTVRKLFDSVVFLLADQPLLQSSTIDHLLERFRKSEKYICVPVYRGKRGNPVIFRRALYCWLMALEGDVGARNIILGNPQHVLSVEVDDPLTFVDIDSAEDLLVLKDLIQRCSCRTD